MIDIQNVKDDIAYFNKKLKDKEPFEEFLKMANQLKNDMSVIENKIHMTKNESRQDPLNYGIRINNRLAFLLADQQRGDYPPTDQAEEVRTVISEELADALFELDVLLKERIDALNQVGQPLGIRIINTRNIKIDRP